ncbi:phage tail family protein [Staphylococcus hominis]|uniref:phage tail domain-containing protein n=1 Tax=Staphylococcus hominis TaxID=1290 RepID=UPI00265B7A39|nr:phage tail domain-containing protein [Staphylococcus hominis]MDO0996584.1 phage tail family protein [Staphylococcus hominis]
MITLTFTLYDENMNEIDYPAGVTPLDFLVSSIERERYEETVNGIPGTIDYGFDFKDREITLKFQMEHYHDTFDFRLQRDELYNIFSSYNHLYVSDNLVPTRVIKLQVDGQFIPERYGYWYSTLEVTGKSVGLPFWQTKYTTQEIEASGYTAIEEKYGLADGVNVDYPNYTFDNKIVYVWNGGNVTIDPRNMPLMIKVNNLTSNVNFTIINETTNEQFVYKKQIYPTTLTLDGTKVLLGPYNYLRDSNRKFISLKPGLNKLKFLNGEFDNVRIDFPFFYK